MANLISRAFDSLYQVWRGLSTVGMHTFRQPITKEFPDVNPSLAGHFRGRLALAVNPTNGEHLCISCLQCERVCPDKCIQITSHKSPETNKPELIEFKIDHGLCMFCGLCTEVCPTSCIINTNDFEMSDYSREALIYDLKKLTLTQDESAFYFDKKELPLPKPKPAKAAAPAAKPAGEAGAAKPAAAAGAAGAAKPEAAAKPAPKPAEKAEGGQAKADAETPADMQAKTQGESKSKPEPKPSDESSSSDKPSSQS